MIEARHIGAIGDLPQIEWLCRREFPSRWKDAEDVNVTDRLARET